MNKIHPIFITVLNEKFANRFTVELDENNNSFISFPAKSPEFGDVDIYEESSEIDIGYIVYVGKFTHCHFDYYTGSKEEKAKEAAEDIIEFLENIFADHTICYGSQKGGGGCYEKGYSEENEYIDYFVWSGIYKRANKKEI